MKTVFRLELFNKYMAVIKDFKTKSDALDYMLEMLKERKDLQFKINKVEVVNEDV